jgi:phage baseplate assembly protein W
MTNARSHAGTRYEALLTLALARATRLAIQAERRTALRKLDEGRLTLKLLEHRVGESQLKLCEADQQVSSMRALLLKIIADTNLRWETC